MSYFPEHINDEIEDGVYVERRTVIKVSAFAIGSMLLGNYTPLYAEASAPVKNNPDEETSDIDFNNLLAEVIPKAKKFIKDKEADEEAYLKEITALVSRLKNITKSTPTNKKIHFSKMYNKFPIKIYQIRMKPGSVLPYHDHRHYNGIIQALEGSATVRNFDFAEETKNIYEASSFKIKETQNIVIKTGNVTNLSRTRDNIHDIRAGKEGVLFLDIFTFLKKNGSSTYLNVDETAVDAKNKIYNASWKK